MSRFRYDIALVLGVIVSLPVTEWPAYSGAAWGQEAPGIELRATKGGVRYGVLGEPPVRPSPVLFIFATSVEQSLGEEAYGRVGQLLQEKGVLSVSLDLPCHGEDVREGEPQGIDGWRVRIERGESPVSQLTGNAIDVLDDLIAAGLADGKRVGACGTSRGGFMALHFAAAEPRVKAVAAFAPVTDLTLLREFDGMAGDERVTALSLSRVVERLAGRSIWATIGNHDERVGTDSLIAFTRSVVSASLENQPVPDIELHVMATEGHRTHATAHDEAAEWLGARLTE